MKLVILVIQVISRGRQPMPSDCQRAAHEPAVAGWWEQGTLILLPHELSFGEIDSYAIGRRSRIQVIRQGKDTKPLAPHTRCRESADNAPEKSARGRNESNHARLSLATQVTAQRMSANLGLPAHGCGVNYQTLTSNEIRLRVYSPLRGNTARTSAIHKGYRISKGKSLPRIPWGSTPLVGEPKPLFRERFREYVDETLGESFHSQNDVTRSKLMARFFAEKVLYPRNPTLMPFGDGRQLEFPTDDN